MTYLAWATFYEGNSDREYFDVLLPRVMEDFLARQGVGVHTVPTTPAIELGVQGREIAKVAKEACDGRDAFHILFVHADTGGRALEDAMVTRSVAYREAAFAECALPRNRTVVIAPRREMEAWAISEREAVAAALGFRGDLAILRLPQTPQAAEAEQNPKAVLIRAVEAARGHRRSARKQPPFAAIAQRQDLARLRLSTSFLAFENELREALVSLGCIPH
ncbi:MAG: DUF4276 family protein [Mesorhizobium sp.]|uniref:DUF4276 family protein n=1 Tax=Mesorhizobium sp. TaxID=1871066 RepID=UPI000F74CA38|nr:DUF4276 family protein [Mesorhizobium sp. M1D.F.Ca.ET.043.01.1.1]RWA94941.1 MAG: DUF4276 family protein [Mesorhizobium sp.]RWE17652.1 MAG: DUF4276 family protein [Mesorhizobium sp.]TJW89855.1 MAG: DUF4276 family protein [Mesorhizobium sp.]